MKLKVKAVISLSGPSLILQSVLVFIFVCLSGASWPEGEAAFSRNAVTRQIPVGTFIPQTETRFLRRQKVGNSAAAYSNISGIQRKLNPIQACQLWSNIILGL
jgi:hypothetical protein